MFFSDIVDVDWPMSNNMKVLKNKVDIEGFQSSPFVKVFFYTIL